MFKIDIYGVSIVEYPNARYRGANKNQIYTGRIKSNGKEDYEEAGAYWFETREAAKTALCDFFDERVKMYQANAERAKASLERANNL